MDSVAYLVKEGDDYPKPFVADANRKNGVLVSPGVNFLRLPDGDTICRNCEVDGELK
jgi:hypothetical protein